MGLGWQACPAAGQVSEEPGPSSTASRCQNSISLHLELLFVQDLGVHAQAGFLNRSVVATAVPLPR